MGCWWEENIANRALWDVWWEDIIAEKALRDVWWEFNLAETVTSFVHHGKHLILYKFRLSHD